MTGRIFPVATLRANRTFTCYPAFDGSTSIAESRWKELEEAGYKLEYGHYLKTTEAN